MESDDVEKALEILRIAHIEDLKDLTISYYPGLTLQTIGREQEVVSEVQAGLACGKRCLERLAVENLLAQLNGEA